MIALLIWLATAGCCAIGQGLLLPAIRRTPSGDEASRQARALHFWLLLAYALPVLLAPASWPAMLLARALAFDPVISVTQGLPLLNVGTTAKTDRLIRWIAHVVHLSPEWVSGLLRLVVAGLAIAWLFRG